MLSPHHLILLVSLLADGGALPLPAGDAGTDAGTPSPRSLPAAVHTDAGTATAIPWPETELEPLGTLDGPAVLAAHAALQEVMKRFPKTSTKSCAFSPRALEFVVGYQSGWYFVRVNRRVEKCPEFGPGVTLEYDWFELYAVSPGGRVERYPYMP